MDYRPAALSDGGHWGTERRAQNSGPTEIKMDFSTFVKYRERSSGTYLLNLNPNFSGYYRLLEGKLWF